MRPAGLGIILNRAEGDRMTLTTFYQDQERARTRITKLEREATAFSAAGKPVPASAARRTARLLRWMWCIEEGENTNEVIL